MKVKYRRMKIPETLTDNTMVWVKEDNEDTLSLLDVWRRHSDQKLLIDLTVNLSQTHNLRIYDVTTGKTIFEHKSTIEAKEAK